MRVVYSPDHLGHDPDLGSFYGRLSSVFEVPARAETIRETLAADDRFAVVAPVAHGSSPITAVHDPELAEVPG